MIRVEGMSKTFGTTVAVRGVSFVLAPGEVVGFLGRNGAGKTTTMRVVTGYFAPTEGRVAVGEHDVIDRPLAARSLIGYLPEQPPLYPEMRVAPFLRFCARLHGVRGPEVARRVEHVLGRCGLANVRGRIIGHLSRGFRQRVGLAQALVHDPDVLVLDEPTTALDPGQIHEIRHLIRALSTEERAGDGGEPKRRTVLLSTHRLEDVTATCDRVLILAGGRIVADETLDEDITARDLERRFLALTAEDGEDA